MNSMFVIFGVIKLDLALTVNRTMWVKFKISLAVWTGHVFA